MDKQDVFMGNVDSFTKKELADIINAAFNMIDHYITYRPNEAGPVIEVGKKMMEMILQDTAKHTKDKEVELKRIENELEAKERIDVPEKHSTNTHFS